MYVNSWDIVLRLMMCAGSCCSWKPIGRMYRQSFGEVYSRGVYRGCKGVMCLGLRDAWRWRLFGRFPPLSSLRYMASTLKRKGV